MFNFFKQERPRYVPTFEPLLLERFTPDELISIYLKKNKNIEGMINHFVENNIKLEKLYDFKIVFHNWNGREESIYFGNDKSLEYVCKYSKVDLIKEYKFTEYCGDIYFNENKHNIIMNTKPDFNKILKK